MQRKVARASGERTLEERADLTKKIDSLTKQKAEQDDLWTLLTQQNKRQSTELRNVEKNLENVQKENAKLQDIMHEVELQNNVMTRAMTESQKKKEEAMVHHEVMKLEVKRLRNLMNQKTDAVCGLENRKQQLQISMEEREVHQEVLKTQLRVAQDEKHRVSMELAERKQKIHNLKNKYETVMKRTKKDDGDHSQAYYVIKAAQVKEELQKKGDSLDADIHSAEREVRALENSLGHLLGRNQKYKDQFRTASERNAVELEEKRMLEEQSRAGNEVLFKKRKQFAQMEKDSEVDNARLEELRRRGDDIDQSTRQLLMDKKQIEEQHADVQDELVRIENDVEKKAHDCQQQGIVIGDGPLADALELEALRSANMALRRALSKLMTESAPMQELNPLFHSLIQERRLQWTVD